MEGVKTWVSSMAAGFFDTGTQKNNKFAFSLLVFLTAH
jgi:hypothetical protein